MDANGMGSAEFISMIFARMDFTCAIPFPALVLRTIETRLHAREVLVVLFTEVHASFFVQSPEIRVMQVFDKADGFAR